VSKAEYPEESALFNEDIAFRFSLEQDDLGALCAERELKTTEILRENDFYGIARLLKLYAGYSEARAIRAVVPHGIVLNDDQIIPYELDALLPAVLTYPDYRAPVYKAKSQMHAIPSASPFVYAARAVDFVGKRSGALFYPAHSTHRLTAMSDYAALADMLLGLGDEFGDISVMVYWRDYQLGHHQPFADRGFRIVSAGHMFDPDFMIRQAYLLKRHEFVLSNAVGSHLFYAAHAGCTVRFIEHEHEYGGDPQHLEHDAPRLSPSRRKAAEAIQTLFSARRSRPSDEQKTLVAEYLGVKHERSPRELADMLEWLDRLDRFGAIASLSRRKVPTGVPRTPHRIVPCAVRRATRGMSILRLIETGLRSAVEWLIKMLRGVFPFLRDVRLRGGQRRER